MKKIFFTLMLISSTILSQTPSVFNLQGVLRLPTGKAVDDKQYSFVFKIYDRATGGDPVSNWSETQNIEVKNGVYNALVGSVTAFTGLAFDRTYFVGITVGGGDELSPRIQLTASPYALSLQGTGNKVPNSGPMTFSSEVYHKSGDFDRIKFNNNGTNDIKGRTTITSNGQTLQFVGTDHSYLEFYPDGIAAGRKGYFGYPNPTNNNLELTNEISGANINLSTTGSGTSVNINNNLNIGGDVTANNIGVKVLEYNHSNINTSNIVVNGLDGNKHKKYKVYFELFRDGGRDDYLHIRMNNDASNSYRFESWYDFFGAGAEESHHNRYGGAITPIRNGWSQDGPFVGEFTIFAESGIQRNIFGNVNFVGYNPVFGFFGGCWTNTTDNLTSIQFAANLNFHRIRISVYAIP